ncbi:hypothetical protein ABKA04_006916 [Annulohypoxylon sp. FPYF3050]
MAVFLAALDITIVSTALPTISDHFQSTSGYTWIGSAFLLAAAVVAPSWGKFSDIWGRKAILLIVTATFFLGSALCGAAVSLEMLIVGRAVQGVGGGGLLSLVSIVVGDLFSQRERGKYYGIVGLVWAVAFTLGPLIGGAFTKNVSWRWCFYVNSFVVIALMLKLETPKTPILAGIKAIDWLGSLALIGGLLMFLLGLEFGGTVYPWDSATVICLIVFGVVTIIIFVGVERLPATFIALQNNVPVQDNAAATASFGLVRNVASAIGVVLGSVAFANRMNAQESTLVNALGPSTANLFSGSNAQANVLLIRTLDAAEQEVVIEAFRTSLREIWIVSVCFAAGGLLASFLIRHKDMNETHVEVKTGLEGEKERRRIAIQHRAGQR